MDPGHFDGQGLDPVSGVGLEVGVGGGMASETLKLLWRQLSHGRFPKDREEKKNTRTFKMCLLF